jgi:hypothetical protein
LGLFTFFFHFQQNKININLIFSYRRKKAKERQKKLMEQFANKQKAFMEQNKDTDVSG